MASYEVEYISSIDDYKAYPKTLKKVLKLHGYAVSQIIWNIDHYGYYRTKLGMITSIRML